ncbi:MAG TPA: transcription termination/antitermination NusG family protein [Lacipirellula sp.]
MVSISTSLKPTGSRCALRSQGRLPPAACFPENLLEDNKPLGMTDLCRWRVVYTKSRQEKALAADLAAKRISHYLPIIPRETFSRGRRLLSFVPAFPGYLFLLSDLEQRLVALETNRVVRTLEVADACQAQLFDDLKQLSRLIADGAPMTVEERILAGQRVRVKRGSLAGCEGIVTSRRGGTRLIVVVNCLQQGVSVEIDDFMLEPI